MLLCDCLIKRIVLIAHCTGDESRAVPCTNIFCLEPKLVNDYVPAAEIAVGMGVWATKQTSFCV